MKGLDPRLVKPENIWNYKQNKPSYVARDLKRIWGVPEWITLSVLMARGVCKWLAVRRDLIKLKNGWKEIVKSSIGIIHLYKKILTNNPKDTRFHCRLWWMRGYLKAYEECRKDIRGLCHSERWRMPDFDKKAERILEKSMVRFEKEAQ